MYKALHYRNGKLREITDLDEISGLISNRRELVWLDLHDPDEQEIEMLGREFGFHRLAIDDVRRGHQRPKVDEYEDYYFIVLYSATYDAERKGGASGFRSSEVDMFVGRNYVVSVHEERVPELEEAIRRWEANPEMVHDGSVGFLLYTICDSIVDNYFPMMDAIEDEIDLIEEKVFVAFSQETIADIFVLRKDLLAVRKIVSPARDVLNALTRRDIPLLDTVNVIYFADVYDHLLRVSDMIETYRDLLSSALDGYLSMTSNNLNQIMKILTAGSIILMSMSLIAGIYGMNFRLIPELEWPFGYAWALGLMALVAMVLFVLFRRRTWL
ncbi:MAG: magnesium/cobalt transporter CorA [Chloroflexi bacterium]|nr:magnesium/cobalt transporter CorA [Chloroflexota bacterium]